MRTLPLLAFLGFAHVAVNAWAQPEWARSPKEIPYQNDAQWEDNRWQATEIGPFLGASVRTPKGTTLKGLALRLGDRGQAAVCFDTARLRMSAAWTGGFLTFDGRRFGLIRRPQADGKLFAWTDKLAGWANNGRFRPEPHEITLAELEANYTGTGTTVVHLPPAWAAYRGFYTCGQRVILSYSVGTTQVLDSPWYVEAAGHGALVRDLEIGPADEPLRMRIADSKCHTMLSGPASARVVVQGQSTQLVIEPHTETVRLKICLTSEPLDENQRAAVLAAAGRIHDLTRLAQEDGGRFPKTLVTQGMTTETAGPYVVDTLTIPFENPYRALFFTSGHDFFSDGSAAICTAHGDVWRVEGIDRDLKELRWRRYATGLYQPLGLRIINDQVYVGNRDQITRLHDRNGDGEADFYECFNNDHFVSPREHDYVACLETDPQGNFYFIHGKTGVMRVSADGSEMTVIADGFRNPNGLGVGPDGTITAAPQQGGWTPESSLIVVKQDGYYGYGGPRVTPERPTGWDLPMCFVPRSMDNSGGGQVWVESDRWGPLQGRMLHLSYGQCRILLALREQVDGVEQGGTIEFPTDPIDFESGVMRGRFSPHDGQLYVSGLRGWQTRAIRDGCFQRVRYTGGPVHLPTMAKTFTNGLLLTFAEPLDPEMAGDPENFFAEQWNYKWSEDYGSPDYSVIHPDQQGRDEVTVVSATLLKDGRSVFLEMPDRHPVMQLSIHWLLKSQSGDLFRGRYAHTINTDPMETMSEDRIERRPRQPLLAQEVIDRLQPGLHAGIQKSETAGSDARLTRLAAVWHDLSKPPTPYVEAGPFELRMDGTLRTPLSGFYDFRLTGTGNARLFVADRPIVDLAVQSETSEPVLLRQGHSPLRIEYQSPLHGVAQFQLWWKGYNFGWEPVPPEVFFHDPAAADLVTALRRRRGRELFADHHCSRCHFADQSTPSMFELSLAPPDLSHAGDRFQEAWLQHWLLTPHDLQPETTMPHVLGRGEDAKQAAVDLAAYLTNLRGSANEPSATTIDESGEGAALFESLACLTCHHFGPAGHDDEFQRRSLRFVNAKYAPGALAEFLQKPTRHAPATTMPDFQLSDAEAVALAGYVRSQAKGELPAFTDQGDRQNGKRLFASVGCIQCHRVNEDHEPSARTVAWSDTVEARGCLATPPASKFGVPDFALSETEREELLAFVRHDQASVTRSVDVEVALRLIHKLQCDRCHDRDGHRSPRALILSEEGSGQVPEVLPSLSRLGEKLTSSWTHKLLAGELDYKPRPWLRSRMPAFPSYAEPLAQGLAAQHGVSPVDEPWSGIDADLTPVGEQLTLQTGLDCRQCHAIGDLEPCGDEKTKIALGINFDYIPERMRYDAYHRFMLDPTRFDVNTRMIRLSENGLTTKLKTVFDADARRQFEAIWHYMQMKK